MALEDIAGYSLRRGLGSGAAGTVWLLRDLGSGRHAVLKRISAALVPAVEEFRRDLALIRSIDYPHLARLLDVRQTDRDWMLISQYVAAGTLTSLLERREPLALGELVTLVSPLAQALAILHRAGLTHGNVTLDNVMFDAEGRPVLTDAGLRLLTAPTPQPPANDLAALADIARSSGGDPRIFTEELFTGDGDEIAHRVLRLAAPEPINLGFGDDPPTSTPTPPPPRTTASPPGQTAPMEAPSTASPSPTGAKPPKYGDSGPFRAPLGSPAADDHIITSSWASAPSEDSETNPPGSTGDARATAPPTIREAPLATATNPGTRAVNGASGPMTTESDAETAATGVAEPATGVATAATGAAKPATGVPEPTTGAAKPTGVTRQPAGSRKTRGSRRTAGRASRSRGRTRRPVSGFRTRLSSRLPAYGVLAVAGLAALSVLVFGLITVGVLGGPSSSSASAANQPSTSDAAAPTGAIPATPTSISTATGAPGNGTTPASPAPSGDPTMPSAPATPDDSTAPSDPTGTANPSAPGNPATPPGTAVPRGPSPSPASAEAETARWLKTLHALDVQRARTFSTLNDAGLDAIYIPGSSPWKSDKSLLASYRDQHVRIEGLTIEIQNLSVEQSSPDTAVLRVVDRLISATAVDQAGHRTPLPPGQPTPRRIVLKATPPSTAWRITEITTR